MIGIVCGTRREATVLAELGHRHLISIALSAAKPDQAEQRARDLIEAGATSLLSAGVAGGLSPNLKTGDLIFANRIVYEETEWTADTPPHQQSDAWIRNDKTVSVGTIIGADEAIGSADQKQELWQRFGALGVDMESHRVALVAQQAGIPLRVLRVIVDDATQTLPRCALNGISPQGREVIGPVLLGLMQRPFELPGLLSLAKRYTIALNSLHNMLSDPDFVDEWIAETPVRSGV